jgi:hypothetical protein
MTKSAKQGTAKAAAEATETESAEQESVVIEADTETETEAEGDPAKPDLDETKRKFREALERKHQGHNEGQGQSARDGSKVNNAHGPASSRRTFRRKSG